MYRTSLVNEVILNSLRDSSVLQTGDTEKIQSSSAALAVQRESTLFGTYNLSYENYKVFSQGVLTPTCPPVKIKKTFHAIPFIQVGKVNILGVASASVLHIGSVNKITLQTRVTHIRHFLKHPYQDTEEEEA